MCCLTHISIGQSSFTDPLEIKFKKLQDDIYLAYRPDPLRFWVEGNVLIIINDNDVVVVEGSGTPRSAQAVIAYIRQLTDKPVAYLINSHGHGDHTIGNQEYREAYPGVEIIAHEGTREYIAGRGYNYVDEIAQSTESRKKNGEEEIARLQAEGKPENKPVVENLVQYYRHDIDVRQAEYKKVTRTPPTLIVNENLRLYRGDRIIDILHIGEGNTASDLIVFLPKERIVCTGDIITEPVPYGFARNPFTWLQTLRRLAEFDFDTLIPGHGEVQTGKAYLQRFMRLFESLRGQVASATTSGLDLEGVRKKVDLSAFNKEFSGDDPVAQYYFDQYFTIPAVERALNQYKLQQGRQ